MGSSPTRPTCLAADVARGRIASPKFSVTPLIVDHYRTLRNARTGRLSVPDFLYFVGVPVASAVCCWVFDLRANQVGNVLAAAAILTGLIFNVFVLLFDLTTRATDRTDPAHRQHVLRVADKLRANVTYAVLVGIALAAVLAVCVMFGAEGQPLALVPTMVVVLGGTQMLLTIGMILKRVRALYQAFRVVEPEVIP